MSERSSHFARGRGYRGHARGYGGDRGRGRGAFSDRNKDEELNPFREGGDAYRRGGNQRRGARGGSRGGQRYNPSEVHIGYRMYVLLN